VFSKFFLLALVLSWQHWLRLICDDFDWSPPSTLMQGPTLLPPTTASGIAASKSYHSNNPFYILFRFGGTLGGRNSVSVTLLQFVHGVFYQPTTDASLFVDWNAVPIACGDSGGMQLQDVFSPFFGGQDDRLALEFAQCGWVCANPRTRGSAVKSMKYDAVRRITGIDSEVKNLEEIDWADSWFCTSIPFFIVASSS
jgi:hypothetical protein